MIGRKTGLKSPKTPRYGHYIRHAHNHITRAVAAILRNLLLRGRDPFGQ